MEEAAHTEGEVHDVESVDEVIPLLDRYDARLPEVTFAKLEEHVLSFEAELRELTNSLGPGRIPKGYVGRQMMVSVMGHVGRMIAEILPKEARLDNTDALDFSIELASILFPNTWGVPTYDITMYDPLLDPNTATSNGPIIRKHAASELAEKAKRRMANIEKNATLTNPDEPGSMCPEDSAQYLLLSQIEAGIYPAPFNSEILHRWLYVDTTLALSPMTDLRDAFRLSPEHIAYLKRVGQIMLADYSIVAETVSLESNQGAQTHIACIREFMESGTLREPWHV